jgi:hypothetical protein
MTLQASRRVPYYVLSRKWSPPNDRAGSPSAATSMTRAVGSSVWRREYVAYPWAPRFGAGSSELEPTSSFVLSGTRVGVVTSCKRGQGRSKPWQPVASNVRRGSIATRADPSAKSSWCEAQALRRSGGADGVWRELRGNATPSLSRIRAATPRVGQRDDSGVGNDAGEESVQRQWRRAFVPRSLHRRSRPFGETAGRAAGGTTASSRSSEGRGPLGNRLEGHR